MAQVAHVQLVDAPGQAGDKLRTRSWIEIQLLGEDGSPIGGVPYAIELPGGKLLAGTLDEQGTARVDPIPPGLCKVSFPELDRDAWTPLRPQVRPADGAAPA